MTNHSRQRSGWVHNPVCLLSLPTEHSTALTSELTNTDFEIAILTYGATHADMFPYKYHQA